MFSTTAYSGDLFWWRCAVRPFTLGIIGQYDKKAINVRLAMRSSLFLVSIFLLCIYPLFLYAHLDLSPGRLIMRCDGAHGRIVQREYDWAMMMLSNARYIFGQPNGHNDHYFHAFFAPAIATTGAAAYAQHLRRNLLKPLERIPDSLSAKRLQVTCYQSEGCQRTTPSPEGREFHISATAHTDNRRSTNFCDVFFQVVPSTDDVRCDRVGRPELEFYRSKGLLIDQSTLLLSVPADSVAL